MEKAGEPEDPDKEFTESMIKELLPIYMNRLMEYLVENNALTMEQLKDIQKDLEKLHD